MLSYRIELELFFLFFFAFQTELFGCRDDSGRIQKSIRVADFPTGVW